MAATKEQEAALQALFAQWDADGSGYLEGAEVNRVVALWNGEDWAAMTAEDKAAHGGEFLELYDDNGVPDKRLDFTEMKEYLVEQAEGFGGEFGADLDLVLGKFAEIISSDPAGSLSEQQQARLAALFAQWDADGSGFLEVTEVNRVVALWNGEDWAAMTVEDKAIHAHEFLGFYDDNGVPDKRLDFVEMKDYLVEQAEGLGDEFGADLDLVL